MATASKRTRKIFICAKTYLCKFQKRLVSNWGTLLLAQLCIENTKCNPHRCAHCHHVCTQWQRRLRIHNSSATGLTGLFISLNSNLSSGGSFIFWWRKGGGCRRLLKTKGLPPFSAPHPITRPRTLTTVRQLVMKHEENQRQLIFYHSGQCISKGSGLKIIHF